jgi:hypothetical protein
MKRRESYFAFEYILRNSRRFSLLGFYFNVWKCHRSFLETTLMFLPKTLQLNTLINVLYVLFYISQFTIQVRILFTDYPAEFVSHPTRIICSLFYLHSWGLISTLSRYSFVLELPDEPQTASLRLTRVRSFVSS